MLSSKMKQLILSILYIFLNLTAFATTLFSHKSNDFKYLLTGNATQSSAIMLEVGDKYLNICNTSNNFDILTESVNLPHNYTYTIKLSTPNNRPGKSNTIAIDDRMTVKTNTIIWGVALDIQPNGDMITIECESDNSKFNDELVNQRQNKLSVRAHSATHTTTLVSKTIDKGINLYDKSNILSVNAIDDKITISMGRKDVKEILSVNTKRTTNTCQAGIIIGPGTRLSIERTMLNFYRDSRMIIDTKWTKDKLDEYFSQATSPIEGYWQYLDRDLEDKWMRLGGNYIIALVANKDNGFDIIYMDGAQTNKTNWKPFLLKGKLYPTIFNNTYQAMWIDSTFEPLNNEVQATIEDGVILSIKFPILKSQLRFSKIIN